MQNDSMKLLLINLDLSEIILGDVSDLEIGESAKELITDDLFL